MKTIADVPLLSGKTWNGHAAEFRRNPTGVSVPLQKTSTFDERGTQHYWAANTGRGLGVNYAQITCMAFNSNAFL